MICQDRDRDLLLLAHHELGLVSRAVTNWHVRNCPRCQKRLKDFGLVSTTFAKALGPRAGERPTVHNPRPTSTGTPMGNVLVVVALLAVIGSAVFMATRSISSPTPTSPVSSSRMPTLRHWPIGCKPGLVSDRCR